MKFTTITVVSKVAVFIHKNKEFFYNNYNLQITKTSGGFHHDRKGTSLHYIKTCLKERSLHISNALNFPRASIVANVITLLKETDRRAQKDYTFLQ